MEYYGLKFTKADPTVIRQMIMELFDEHDYLQGRMTINEVVAKYGFALKDAVNNAKHAAGTSCKFFRV